LSTLFKASLPCLVALGCSCAGSADPGAFRSYLESEPTSLDPAFAVDVSSGVLCSLIYERLVRPGDDLSIEPSLAGGWEVSPDGTVYTFHLREAYFSDGKRITAGDVKHSLERLLRPDVGSPRGWVMAPVVGAEGFRSGRRDSLRGIRAVDERTVEISLKEPFPAFLSMLAMPSASVVPEGRARAAAPDDRRDPICSGPWVLLEWTRGERVTLARNPRHWGPPALDRLVFRIIPERMTQIAEFEVGNLDHLQIPKSDLARWTSDPAWRDRIERQVDLAVVYIGLNNRKPPLDDARVRRALNHAVDAEAIVTRLMNGTAVRARGAVPPGLPGHDPDRPAYRYDVSLARELLARAGYPDGFRMEIWYREGGGADQVLEAIQAYLKDAGVAAVLRAREWGTLKEAINRGVPDAYYLDWYADYPDAENFLYPLFHSDNWGGGGNRARYSDSAVDSLLEEASRVVSSDERYELYLRIDERVYKDAPWIFLWHPVTSEVRQPWVRGDVLHPLFYGQRFTEVTKTGRSGRDAG